MPRGVSRAWRQLRTGLVFVYYFVGAAVLAVWIQLRAWFVGKDVRAAQRSLQRGYASFVWLMGAFGIIRVTCHGTERLAEPGPKLIVANHPSLIDSALVVSRLPQADNFISPEWARHPLLRGLVESVDCLPSDEGPGVIAEAAMRLRDGRTVVMFPEGTRSPGEGLGRFHRGAAHVALASGCDLLPVAILIDPPTTKKGQAWHDVPDRPAEVELRVLPPLSPSKVLDGSESPLIAARKVTAALREAYEEVLDLD